MILIHQNLPGLEIQQGGMRFNSYEEKVLLFFTELELWDLVGNGRRVSFISGDDDEANEMVKKIITALGFEVIILGGLQQGGKITDIGAPLLGLNLVSYPIR